MSTLRDEIEAIIDQHITSDLTEDGVVDTYVRSDEAADAILALIRDRLLSDEAAESGAKALAFVGLEPRYPDPEQTWREADEPGKEMFRVEYRTGVTAALDTITGDTP